MKEDLKNKIIAEANESANFFDTLPTKIHGFSYRKIFEEDGDKFIYFAYDNFESHRGITAYFHEETQEYKVLMKIGLNEFCLTKFFTENFSDYCKKISDELEKTVENISENNSELNLVARKIKLSAWEYGKNLPQNIGDFELFISPKNPVKFTNGSYIIINYSDFKNNSDFTICYNIYTENFSAEYTENLVPHVSYLFDAENLKDLEKKLHENLSAELLRISQNKI